MHWIAPSEEVIRSSSSTAANYRSACRAQSRTDSISKLGTVEEEADESGFWLEMLQDILQLRTANDEFRMPGQGAKPDLRQSQLDIRTLQELERMLDEGDRDKGRVITGSSNFTEAGLQDNLEFNVELKNRSDYALTA